MIHLNNDVTIPSWMTRVKLGYEFYATLHTSPKNLFYLNLGSCANRLSKLLNKLKTLILNFSQ
jgi:hypothetical protein